MSSANRRFVIVGLALGWLSLGARARATEAAPRDLERDASGSAGARSPAVGDTHSVGDSAADTARLGTTEALASGVTLAARAIGPAVVRVEIGLGDHRFVAVSGLIIDTLGHVITDATVVVHARTVAIVTEGGRWLPAFVRGIDQPSGLAVLSVEGRPPTDLQAARFGDSDLVEVGDWVLAVGRRSDARESVSTGIISGRLQPAAASPISASVGAAGGLLTDATIDAGNVGGPIVKLDGEVIAVSAAEDRGGSPGRAIPINQARRVAQMIIADGETRYPYIGVALLDVEGLDPQQRARLGPRFPWHGAVVNHILRGAPAARAGLRPGDVITTIDNLETRAAEDVVDRISYHAVGERLTVGFVRDGETRSAQVSVDALPPGSMPTSAASSRVNTN